MMKIVQHDENCPFCGEIFSWQESYETRGKGLRYHIEKCDSKEGVLFLLILVELEDKIVDHLDTWHEVRD